jgi:hypothetical protein
MCWTGLLLRLYFQWNQTMSSELSLLHKYILLILCTLSTQSRWYFWTICFWLLRMQLKQHRHGQRSLRFRQVCRTLANHTNFGLLLLFDSLLDCSHQYRFDQLHGNDRIDGLFASLLYFVLFEFEHGDECRLCTKVVSNGQHQFLFPITICCFIIFIIKQTIGWISKRQIIVFTRSAICLFDRMGYRTCNHNRFNMGYFFDAILSNIILV